jgi:hypothetical protein
LNSTSPFRQKQAEQLRRLIEVAGRGRGAQVEDEMRGLGGDEFAKLLLNLLRLTFREGLGPQVGDLRRDQFGLHTGLRARVWPSSFVA